MQRFTRENSLALRCICTLILTLFSSFLFGQVTMFDPFSPYRADDVMYNRNFDGSLNYITYTGVWTGMNENNLFVGYKDFDLFIDEEDFLAGFEAMLNLPDPGEVLDVFTGSGFVLDGGVPSMMGLDANPFFDGLLHTCEGQGTKTLDACWARLLQVDPARVSTFVARLVGTSSGGNCNIWYVAMYDPASFSMTDTAWLSCVSSPVCYAWGNTPMELIPGECPYAFYTPEFIPLSGDDLARFIGPDEFNSGGVPDTIYPRSIVRRLTQNERSQLLVLSPHMDELSETITDAYESDAYQGYPGFQLYFGFFSGVVQPPVDEGDCEGDFCTPVDGGGGGAGVDEYCTENPNALICEQAGEEDVTGLLDDIASFVDQTDDIETEISSLTDLITEYALGDGPELADPVGVCPFAGGIELPPPLGSIDTTALCEATGGPIRQLILMLSIIACAIIVIRGVSA